MTTGADEHLTSTEAARLLGVSAATIKRWSDDGVISTVRTPGGHRRFRRIDISLAAERLFRRTGDPELAEVVLAHRSVLDVQARLIAERARLGSWAAVAEACVPVLGAIATRGSDGTTPYLATVIARDILEAAVSRCADEMPTVADAPRAVVATVDEQSHGVALALVRLCLRAASWTAWRVGLADPANVASFVAAAAVDAVVLYAGASCAQTTLEPVLGMLSPRCNRAGASLVLAGHAAWPADARWVRVRTMMELQAWIERTDRPRLATNGTQRIVPDSSS